MENGVPSFPSFRIRGPIRKTGLKITFQDRHDAKMSYSASEYHRKYGLTKAREKAMKKEAIIMHPAPINRGVEIDTDLVECERSRVFKQMQNGVFARMAILKETLEKEGYTFK